MRFCLCYRADQKYETFFRYGLDYDYFSDYGVYVINLKNKKQTINRNLFIFKTNFSKFPSIYFEYSFTVMENLKTLQGKVWPEKLLNVQFTR